MEGSAEEEDGEHRRGQDFHLPTDVYIIEPPPRPRKKRKCRRKNIYYNYERRQEERRGEEWKVAINAVINSCQSVSLLCDVVMFMTREEGGVGLLSRLIYWRILGTHL